MGYERYRNPLNAKQIISKLNSKPKLIIFAIDIDDIEIKNSF